MTRCRQSFGTGCGPQRLRLLRVHQRQLACAHLECWFCPGEPLGLPRNPPCIPANSSCLLVVCVRPVLHDLQHGEHEPTVVELPQHVRPLSSEPHRASSYLCSLVHLNQSLFLLRLAVQEGFLIKASPTGRSRSRVSTSGSDDVSLAGPTCAERPKTREKQGENREETCSLFARRESCCDLSPSLQHDVAANPRGNRVPSHSIIFVYLHFEFDHLRVANLDQFDSID